MSISDGVNYRHAAKIELSRRQDVQFQSGDAIIAGTHLIPLTTGPFPAVIIAHSSAVGERHAYWIFASQLVQDALYPNLAGYDFAPGYLEDVRRWIKSRAQVHSDK